MSHAEVAERYARAIFELGTETGQLTQLTEQMARLAETYTSSRDLQVVLEDPVVAEAQRFAVLDELAARAGLSQLGKNAVSLLVQRRRLAVLPEIAERLRSLADEKNGVLRVTVTSAAPLAEEYLARLVAQVERSSGKRVIVERKQDANLIAGVVTKIGNHTIDGSLRGRLEQVEHQLMSMS